MSARHLRNKRIASLNRKGTVVIDGALVSPWLSDINFRDTVRYDGPEARADL